MATIKHRSPNYPGIDLNEAVEAIKRIYPYVQRGEFTANDVANKLGYKSVSGPVRRKVGALKQYGLIDQKKGDNIKLSNRGLTICLRNPASEDYRLSIREAALEPPLFKEFFEAGKHLSSDDVLRQELIVNRNFTDEGASRFIQVLRESLALANINELEYSEDNENEEESPELGDYLKTPQGNKTREKIPLHLVDDINILIELPHNMTERSWAHMLRFLDVMKDGYVKTSQEQKMINKQTTHRVSKLSKEAKDLIDEVDKGGIPMNITQNLQKIAEEHDIPLTENSTPNEIIDELRKLT